MAKSLLLQEANQQAWIDTPLPALEPDDLRLRTRTGAISLGTEIPLYEGKSRGSHTRAYPFMTGYESVAEVVACGATVKDVQVGDRVVAFYGHRTAAVVPADKVVPVPADIPDELAVLLILACDTAKGVSKIPLDPGDCVAIAGGGPIGLLTLFNLHAHGLRHITLIEPVSARRDLALRFGAQSTISPNSVACTDYAHSFCAGFECSSRDNAFHLLQDLMQPHGTICIVADGNLEPLTLAPTFHAKELTVVGSSDGLDYWAYAQWFWQQVRSSTYPLEELFQRTVDATSLPQAFASLARAVHRPLKVLVRYPHAK